MFRILNAIFRLAAATREEYSGMHELDSPAALARCLEHSTREPIFILKHSTRCPISSRALSEVKAYLEQAGEDAAPVYINLVVESRGISNEIAAILGLRHESPQIMLVSAGQVVWQASHGGIRAESLATALTEYGGSE